MTNDWLACKAVCPLPFDWFMTNDWLACKTVCPLPFDWFFFRPKKTLVTDWIVFTHGRKTSMTTLSRDQYVLWCGFPCSVQESMCAYFFSDGILQRITCMSDHPKVLKLFVMKVGLSFQVLKIKKSAELQDSGSTTHQRPSDGCNCSAVHILDWILLRSRPLGVTCDNPCVGLMLSSELTTI